MSDPAFTSRQTLTMPRESIAFAPGTVIGDYKIISLLAEGSQATLFQVCDQASAPFVLRVYFDGCAPDRTLTAKLLNANDERICQVLTHGEYDGHIYDVVPLLRALPDIGCLPEQEQDHLLAEEAEAIKRFHSTGFCHLDIKREHFMSDGQHVKLIDIGSAIKIGSSAPETHSQFLPLSAYTGTVNPADDLFSFGIAILEQFLPHWLEGEDNAQIGTILACAEELQKAIAQLPSRLREDVQLLLSDAPDVRITSRWFRPGTETDTGPCTARVQPGSLSKTLEAVRHELLAVAVYCAPEVFVTTVKPAGAHVDFQSAASVQSFLSFLQSIPKGNTQVNYTTLTYDNVMQALQEQVIIEHRKLSKGDPIRTLHHYQQKHILYIFDRQLIDRLDEQGVEISNERDKRAFAVLKTIGIVLGVLLALCVAVAVIIAVLYILLYVIGILIIIGIICAFIRSS